MFQKISDLLNAAKKGADLFTHFDEVLAKIREAREALDEIRVLVDEADDGIEALTANGRNLPDQMKPLVPLLAAFRRIVDMLDDAADKLPETDASDARASIIVPPAPGE